MNNPKMTHTRFMAYIAFLHFLLYSSLKENPSNIVMYIDLGIIMTWALGRATLVELMQIWKGK